VDNQGLGQQGLDEPAGRKQSLGLPGVEHPDHCSEGRIVEDRADRPNEQRAAEKVVDLPALRLSELLVVDPVGRDGSLGEVVEQGVGKHLDRHDGQEPRAPRTLNMFPNFDEAPNLTYLVMLPNTRRPSTAPWASTARLLSSRMMSADSLATSTAVSTEPRRRRPSAPARR
jgi:hypothetical protein